jgi:hypothetical protein
VPLAPGRLSITMFWPSRALSGGPMMRAMKSVAPPGGLPVTRWIGRDGYDCASAPLAPAQATQNSKSADIRIPVNGFIRYPLVRHASLTGVPRLNPGLAAYRSDCPGCPRDHSPSLRQHRTGHPRRSRHQGGMDAAADRGTFAGIDWKLTF